jgi:hypothetical protein
VPPNKQHPDPIFLLPYNWMWLQMILPYIIGGLIGALILRQAAKKEKVTKRSR